MDHRGLEGVLSLSHLLQPLNVSFFPLQSLNGVYVDGKTKIKPLTPTPLQTGCEICFGTIIPRNELKYSFLQTDSGSHLLLRVGAKPPPDVKVINTPSLSTEDVTSPAVEDVTLQLATDTIPRVGTPPLNREVTSPWVNDETPPLVKRPRLKVESPCGPVAPRSLYLKLASPPYTTDVQEYTTNPLSMAATSSSEAANIHVTTANTDPPLTPQPDSDMPFSTPETPIYLPTSASQFNLCTPSTSKAAYNPSPSVPLTSPASVIDDLFSDTGVEKRFDDIVSDAIFGEEGDGSPQSVVGSGSGGHVDGTSIQIQAAREEMEREKQKLLSNIEALKSELSSKERLLAEKSEKEKTVEDFKKQKEGILDSMQEEFTCVICQELFVTAHTLTCSHSFCESCIKEWMKVQKKKDCPICRKTITAEPVHSLVLDNAIDKMVEKMDDDTKEGRRKLKESHALALNKFKPAITSTGGRSVRSDIVNMLAAASALGVLTSSGATGGSGAGGSGAGTSGSASGSGAGPSGRRGGASGSGAGPSGRHGGPSGRHGGRTTGSGSANSPIYLSSDTPQRRHRHTERYEYDDDEYDDEYDDDEDDEDCSDDSDDFYDPGISGHYYGGYGRCFNCGEFSMYLQV